MSIKVAKYAGITKVDLVENYGYCSLNKATNYVLEKMKIENVTKARVTNIKRIEKNFVEPVPLREALINSIVHNDFSREILPVFEIFNNRIEITSYGGLIPGQSIEDFFSCSSMPRNRELMRVFKDLGLVEQLGAGMSRILQSYDRSIFEISGHFIKVVFPFLLSVNDENIANGDICSYTGKIIFLLEKEPYITAKKMSEQTDLSTRKISHIIRELRESEMIIRVGSSRKGYWEINKSKF